MLTDYELHKPTSIITLQEVYAMMQDKLCIKILQGLSIIQDASDVEFWFDANGYVTNAYLPHVFGPDTMYNIYGETEEDEEYGKTDRTMLCGALPCIIYGIRNVHMGLPSDTGYDCISSDVFLKYDMYIYHSFLMEKINRTSSIVFDRQNAENENTVGPQGDAGPSVVYNITLIMDEKRIAEDKNHGTEGTQKSQNYTGSQGSQGYTGSHGYTKPLYGTQGYYDSRLLSSLGFSSASPYDTQINSRCPANCGRCFVCQNSDLFYDGFYFDGSD